jgi:N-acetylglucosamine-6-sulfatase
MLACCFHMGVTPVPIRRVLLALVLVLGLAAIQWRLLATETTRRPAAAQTPGSPNIVLIVTDDQRFDTLRVMPEVQRLLMAKGMTLRRAIVTNPLCCPSRATIYTGRYAHTTGVYTNSAPSGGWSAFQASESNTIATALHDVGYRTALIGKYLNGYTGDAVYVPPGWDRWFAFTGTPGYFDYSVYDDTFGHVSYGSRPRDYSTDVLREQAVAFIRGVPQGVPFFLVVTPYAPHGPSLAAPRHEGVFASAPVPVGPAVNEADVSDKPAYVASGPVSSFSEVRARTRDQWESLLAVDELVSRIMTTLADTGRENNTLVIFTSDNGFSNREHRWQGKQAPYEESIRVPMVVRLPGSIPPDTVSRALVSNVDLAPTIADFAGASISADGVSMRPLLVDPSSSVRDGVLLEHVQGFVPVPTYCGVRTSSFTFVHYITGEEELYDLVQDPHQLRNVASRRPNRTAHLRALTESLCRPVPPGFSW